MKVLIDTCVLFPTVMREVLLGVAEKGLFTPIWSARILEEWARASVKLGPLGEIQARAEIAVVRANWPDAEVTWKPSLEARLWLPDSNDVHVLAAAISGSADAIITLNRKDFPRGTLKEEGLDRADPDGFLYGLWLDHPEVVETVGKAVLVEANAMQEVDWDLRGLLKKARLPKLAKALSA
ncbi:MAG: PIN domain-containing protein [Paracoccaceae bacterium]